MLDEIKQIRLEDSFEIFDKKGNYLELGKLYLEEHINTGTGNIDYYNLRIKLLGHENTFIPEELKKVENTKSTKEETQGEKS